MPDIAITQRFEAIVRTGEGDPAALARAAKQGEWSPPSISQRC